MECELCQACKQTRDRSNPFAVAETRHMLIMLGWYQPIELAGNTVVLTKNHVPDFGHLTRLAARSIEEDIELVSQACLNTFEAKRVDAAVSNDGHYMIHIYPRYSKDACRLDQIPVGTIFNKSTVPDQQRLSDLRCALQAKLAERFHVHERDDFKLAIIQKTVYPPHLL